jgi:predicted HicB family RNase H-like nuclease
LDFCIELGRTPEKPFSGKLILRLPPEIHERAAYTAKKCGLSLNAWIKQSIEQILNPVGDQHRPKKHA